jgi:FKBP-type peptidyl-prolyl cis-trans isomerase
MRSLLLLLCLLLAACPAPSGSGGDDDDSVGAIDDDDDATEDPAAWRTVTEGLEVRDVELGDGALIESGDGIRAHYTLWLYEDEAKGTLVETSRNGGPFSATVGVGQLIQGWELGIPGMREGGQRELIIAPELAYGAQGSGTAVPPNATLFFEVEIVERL